jgi:sorting nexin-14
MDIADDDDDNIIPTSLSSPSTVLFNHESDVGGRDLTRWRVYIDCVQPRRDTHTGRTVYVYVLKVERTDLPFDNNQRSWTVDRRYHEFYILESKLIEFHTESIITQRLPPKRTFASKGRSFVETLRPNFQHFMQHVCAEPLLKGSELLFTFLTSKLEIREQVKCY